MNSFRFPIICLLLCASALGQSPSVHDVEPKAGGDGDHVSIRGMTISCQTWGWEWGTIGFGAELDRLGGLGANWIAIHPYASIGADGTVSHLRSELVPDSPPDWLTVPRAESIERDIALLVKPHLAYWGSPFAWRGAITFPEAEFHARFWHDYSEWIVALASAAGAVDAFCVGTELDGFMADEEQWRDLIARVRRVTDARLTYAANWDGFEQVPFWDALDAIGVQAYFPLSEDSDPSSAELRAGWKPVLARLKALHVATGKPVVFTELGYSASTRAASNPWEDPERGAPLAPELQRRCLAVSLEILARESDWLRGAFLWKWFVGPTHSRGGSFLLDEPELRSVIADAWRAE